ncbi:MAG TPA: DNA methyltransferase, partial [Verrucomicrobiae bacterium]|nr:DNA methyltransferase [Verrucomicrobiae bacterium]
MQIAPSKIRKDFARLKPREEWSFRNSRKKELGAYSHGYHRYPAKFIPQIVRRVIEEHTSSENALVCDPFGGCGTTLVEAKISGRRGIAFDINPVASLITNVKITAIRPQLLKKEREIFLKRYSVNRKYSVEHRERIKYWFDTKTLKKLDKIYSAIRMIKDARIRNF